LSTIDAIHLRWTAGVHHTPPVRGLASLRQGVVGISEIIIKPGLVNVDFADVRAVMGSSGAALMGVGTGSGNGRARTAAIAAVSCPLIDHPVTRATRVVFNVVGGPDLSLNEVQRTQRDAASWRGSAYLSRPPRRITTASHRRPLLRSLSRSATPPT
jgi:hypothetical protein